ncbi:MAG: hypothetical protein IJD79_10095, partial [Clostridia bacterium]|nr:hypothetical protein [Clostridia bacterium]
MKKKFLSLLLLICITATAVFGLAGCNNGDDDITPSPEKLSAPVIVLTDDTATWDADPNADKFEISKNGKLSFAENTYVSEKLTDGDTLKVRAVGDGTKYETSDWSNTVTYTAPNTHECDFSGEWKSDATHHWHECSCGLTDTKVAHSGGTATETEQARCSVCNAPYGELLTPPAHECDFTGEWKSDATHHWHECSCGLTDTKVAHSGGTATETEQARCSVCNAPYGELLTPPA